MWPVGKIPVVQGHPVNLWLSWALATKAWSTSDGGWLCQWRVPGSGGDSFWCPLIHPDSWVTEHARRLHRLGGERLQCGNAPSTGGQGSYKG